MTLLDRYVDAVRKRLPRKDRDDIAAELRESLLSQVEAERADRGRALTDDEVGAILKRYGAPEAVAVRYGARAHLIGPAVFPHYAAVVKVVLWILVPVLSLWVVGTAVTADHPLRSTALAIWSAGAILLVNLAVVTLLFARIERLTSQSAAAESWDPGQLPPDPARPRSRSEAVGSLVVMAFWFLWWTGVLPLNEWIGRANRWLGGAPTPLALAPAWDAFSPAIITLMIAAMALDLISMARPRLVRVYEAGHVLLDISIVIMVYQLLRAPELIVVTEPQAAGAPLAGLAHLGLVAGLLLLALIAGVNAAFTIRRLLAIARYSESAAVL